MKFTVFILAMLFSVQIFAQENMLLTKEEAVLIEVSKPLSNIDESSIPSINRAGVYFQRATYSKLIFAGASVLSVTSLILPIQLRADKDTVMLGKVVSGLLGATAILFGVMSINYELKAGKSLRFHATENGIGATIKL